LTPSEAIIYQKRAWTILSRAFRQGRTAGTYLLHGPDGTGRWLSAVSFAALLNCESPVALSDDGGQETPCGKCVRCRNVFNLNFEGLHFAVPVPPHDNKLDGAIDLMNEFFEAKREEPFRIVRSSAATNIPVAVAREIRRQVSLKASEGIRRVVVFYQMEKMKAASADALLKMIEEPPADTTIVLITNNADSQLPTIQSRAQKIRVDRVPSMLIERYLADKYRLSENKVKLISRLSEGSLGRAIDAVDSAGEDEISQRGVSFLLFKSLFWDSGPDTLARMNDVLNFRDRGDAEELLRVWQLLIRDCANVAVTGDGEDVVNVDFIAEIEKLSRFFAAPGLASLMVEDIKNALADMRLNVHIQGALMALALRLKARIGMAN
jgi:DNA polymerase-3 subunit delta'